MLLHRPTAASSASPPPPPPLQEQQCRLVLAAASPRWDALCTTGADVQALIDIAESVQPASASASSSVPVAGPGAAVGGCGGAFQAAFSRLVAALGQGSQGTSIIRNTAHDDDSHDSQSNGDVGSAVRRSDESTATTLTLATAEQVVHLALCVRQATTAIEQALQIYKTDTIMLSFNGGKDCMVVLHLLNAVLRTRCGRHNAENSRHLPIPAIYLSFPDQFHEVESFVREAAQDYSMDLFTIDGSIKAGLTELSKQRPQVRAIFAGTRRTDPFSASLETCTPTDPDWPQFMRINPILDWSYADVWLFLRAFRVPYCHLYDLGYTSLGGRSTTSPNPALLRAGTQSPPRFSPAYLLQDGSKERDGRRPSLQPQSPQQSSRPSAQSSL
ncbi:flavin adenine dinucleotide synthetase [Capsaspora owczarzaki ATCC 30864]|uniref:FAD synthase n=1 Tax=Capsaspora owczarzaki (strain ATCC 30864) TaxID=595528 RepID=A0A0D2X2T3_CAPO3|nr:flavin adenine dinucleotide synthetase [Capsaspora owczarzaki ATCC 30864]KJE93109.1 flavin adenine dinucleotide synthetase [Capsaspora owczarzaki ATCC 30864]|eukprot:XP_004363675.1 flavin adenine dinucleotide synthetase [Capsaspora owczarzaki ATCC 30864]